MRGQSNFLIRCTVRSILDLVSARFSISLSEITGPSRRAELVEPRHVAMYLARLEGHSLPKIGRIVRRDHTTVLHGAEKIKRQSDTDPELRLILLSFANELNQLRAKIAQNRRDRVAALKAAIIKFETENAHGASLPHIPLRARRHGLRLTVAHPPSQRRAPARQFAPHLPNSRGRAGDNFRSNQ